MITPRIKKRGNLWTAVVNLPQDEGMPRRQKRISGKTKKEVERSIVDLFAEINKGTFFEPTKQTFAEYFNWWIDNSIKYSVTPKTYERYVGIVRKHLIPEFGRTLLSALQPFHVQQYYSQARKSGRIDGKGGGLSGTTLRQHHAVIRRALNEAVSLRLILHNPVLSLKAPQKEKHTVRTLTATELKKLLASLEGRYYYLPCYLAAHTGARRGEILGLRWQDVDLDGRVIRISQTLAMTDNNQIIFGDGKTVNARRVVDISKEVVSVLRKHKAKQAEIILKAGAAYQDNNLVCANEDGSPMNPNLISSYFKRAAKKLGLEISFHGLRHTHATLLMLAGTHPKVVSARLGHASVSFTLDTYSHLIKSMQQDAAEDFTAILAAVKREPCDQNVTKS